MTRTWIGAALAASLVLSFALPAAAGDDSDPETYRQFNVGTGKVTLDVQDAPLGQVVEERLQPRTRVNIIVSPDAAEQRVTLRVVDLHWSQALDAMVERIGGVMVRKAPNLLRVERPAPVSIDFKDRPIEEVIAEIAKFGDANVIVSPRVNESGQKITLSLNNVPWDAALEAVVKTVGFALVRESYGIMRVVPRADLTKDLDQDYYRFRFLRPPPAYKGVMAANKQGGGGGSTGGAGGGSGGGAATDIYLGEPTVPTDDPSEIEANFPIIAALRQIVEPEEGGVQYIPQENAIIFTGTRPRVQRLRELVEDLDVEPPQVFIDMNFVVTSNSDSINLGLRAGDTSGIRIGASGSDILHMLPFNLGGGSGLANAIAGTPFAPPTAAAYTYGSLTSSETSLLWEALQRDATTRIVQAPKLIALDNQSATIFIGETIRYARTTAATNQNGGLQFSVEEDPNSPVNVGFQLLVIPHVIPGEEKVRMTVIPQRRALTGTGPLPGFDRITVSGQSIDLPRVQSSTLVTHMILRDNQTAVIGGLLEDRDVERVDKIPLLGDLPLAGLIFQGKAKTTVKEHLLITITPRIERGTDAANPTITDELAGRSQATAAEYRDLRGECIPWPGQGGNGGFTAAPPRPAPPAEPLPVAPGR
jgi:type II secretory pathway component GspD/PulD (secretin)